MTEKLHYKKMRFLPRAECRRGRGGNRRTSLLAGLGVLVAVSLFVNASSSVAALEHVVQPGDTLGALALRYGVTVEELVEINRITNKDLIFVGDTLQIPDAVPPAAVPPTTVPSSTTVPTAPPTVPPVVTPVPSGATTTIPATPPVTAPPPPPIPTTTSPIPPTVPSTTVPPSLSPTVPSTTIAPTVPPTTAPSTPPADDENTLDSPDTLPEGVTSVVEWVPYTIRAGDWLSSLAKRYDTTVAELARVNVLSNTNLIYVGQVILVPTSSTEGEPASPTGDSPSGMTVEQRLDYWASHYRVPPEMLKALTWWESGWNNKVISSVGAIGIGQLLPTTVDFVADVLIGADLNPHIIDDNIRMTARFVRYLLDETGNDRRLTLASYYQGLYAVRKYGIYKVSIPYVNGILALQDRFRP